MAHQIQWLTAGSKILWADDPLKIAFDADCCCCPACGNSNKVLDLQLQVGKIVPKLVDPCEDCSPLNGTFVCHWWKIVSDIVYGATCLWKYDFPSPVCGVTGWVIGLSKSNDPTPLCTVRMWELAGIEGAPLALETNIEFPVDCPTMHFELAFSGQVGIGCWAGYPVGDNGQFIVDAA